MSESVALGYHETRHNVAYDRLEVVQVTDNGATEKVVAWLDFEIVRSFPLHHLPDYARDWRQAQQREKAEKNPPSK